MFNSCTIFNAEQDTVSNIQFVKSLKKSTTSKSIAAIDSTLNINVNAEEKALLFFEKGKLLALLQKDKEAVIYFNKALTYFKAKNDKENIAKIYWHLGSEHAFLSDKVEALSFLLKAQELNVHKNKKLEANIYISLAHVQYLYKEYLESIAYSNEAAAIQEKEKDTIGLAATYNNLAVVYKNIGEFYEALNYNKKSLKLNVLLDDKSAIAKSYNNLGLVSEEIGNYVSAMNYYKKSIAINNEIGSVNTNPLKNLASLYFYVQKTEDAKEIYLAALAILKKHPNIKKQKDIYNELLRIAIKQKDFKNSLLYQKKSDSLYILEREKENEENLKLAENQYQLITKKNDLLKVKNTNRKNKFIFAIILLFLLFILVYRQVKNKNKKLKNEKERMFLEQKVLRSQMNPHFIFNALSAIQNSLLDNEPIKSASYLSRFAKLVRQNFDFIDKRKIILVEEIDALTNYLETQKMRYHDKFDYEINTFADIDVNTVEIPPLLLQPFVENAIEHGFKRINEIGKIAIKIYKKQNTICFEIIDNGVGFEKKTKDNRKHAIDIFLKRLELRGFGEEKSFDIRSSKQGTTVKFCLKL